MTIRGTVTVGLVALVGAMGLVACGGSDSSSDDDDSATGGSGSSGDDTGAAGNSAADDDDATGDVYPCSNNPMDAFSEVITDWSVATAGSDGNYNWGASDALTGGTFTYDNVPDDGSSALTLSVAAEALNVSGDVEEYAGFGLWFGPCLNGSMYTGISFTISGDLGNSELQLQVQTSKNYPADAANQKGECVGDWDTCVSNSFVTEVAASADAPADHVVVNVAWSDLAGGMPVDGLDGSDLLGIQWQFNCASGSVCTPNITMDDIKFTQ